MRWAGRRRSIMSGSGSARSMVLAAAGGRLVWSDLSSPGGGGIRYWQSGSPPTVRFSNPLQGGPVPPPSAGGASWAGAAFTFLLGPFQDPGRGSMWPLWPEPRLPLKWRNILKENLKTRVLCTPRLRRPSPEGNGQGSGGCASRFRLCLGATEPRLCVFMGCRLARHVPPHACTTSSTDTGLFQCLGCCKQRRGQHRGACVFLS